MRKLLLVVIAIASFCSALTCEALALPADPLDELLPPNQLLGHQELWEMQSSPRTDAMDQRQWHGCVYTDDVSRETAYAEIHRANNLAGSHHFDEAIQQLSDAIERLPLEFQLRLSRAKLYIKVRQNDRAREDLRIAITKGTFDMFVEFEIEKLLVKLGEYQLVVQTTPAMLSKLPGRLSTMNAAQFQYLLACSQEQLGDAGGALENYSAAAKSFKEHRAFRAVTLCMKHINDIASSHKLTALVPKDLTNWTDDTTAGVPELKAMIKHLLSDSDCLTLAAVQKLTRDPLYEIRPGCYGQSAPGASADGAPISRLKALQGIEFSKFHASNGLVLGLPLSSFDCRLLFTDLDDILHNHHQLTDLDWFRTRGYTNHVYKVPSGTLLFIVDSSGAVIRINLYDKEALEQAERESQQILKSRRRSLPHTIESGDVDDAIAITDDWLKDAPEDVDAHMYHGQALALAGKYDDAIKEMNFVINYVSAAKDKRRFNNPFRGNRPLILKGTYQTALGQYAEALQTFSQAFPKTLNADDYFDRAKAEVGMGRLKDACADLEQAVKLYYDTSRIVRRDEAAKLLQETQAKVHS